MDHRTTTDLPALKQGQTLTAGQRMPFIIKIAEELEDKDITVSDVKRMFEVDYKTARNWFNQAAMLIVTYDNGLTREGMRRIHEGQINRRLKELARLLDQTTDVKERLAIDDRIVKYLDAKARVTGLNSEQVEHTVEHKPLQIILPSMSNDTNTTIKPAMSHNVIDGEVVNDDNINNNNNSTPQ